MLRCYVGFDRTWGRKYETRYHASLGYTSWLYSWSLRRHLTLDKLTVSISCKTKAFRVSLKQVAYRWQIPRSLSVSSPRNGIALAEIQATGFRLWCLGWKISWVKNVSQAWWIVWTNCTSQTQCCPVIELVLDFLKQTSRHLQEKSV